MGSLQEEFPGVAGAHSNGLNGFYFKGFNDGFHRVSFPILFRCCDRKVVEI